MSKEEEKPEKGNARRTLFVRNLPYSTSDDQLSSVFVKYGAIKSCFTVKDKGKMILRNRQIYDFLQV